MEHIHTFESFLNESNNEVIFSIDDDKLDQMLNSRFSSQLDYKDDGGDSFYILDRRDFDRFIDLADSSGFDVDYENSEDSVISVQESIVNESTEVSVEKITTPAERKALKNAFENIVTGIDKLSFKKDGTIEGKRGYFYRHGITPEKTANELTSALKSQGINITVIDYYDDFKPWPKDSNFVVVFKISGVNESVNESVNEAMQIKKGDFVRYKKDEEFTGGKVLNISSGKAEISNWDGSTIELPVADLEYIESWNR